MFKRSPSFQLVNVFVFTFHDSYCTFNKEPKIQTNSRLIIIKKCRLPPVIDIDFENEVIAPAVARYTNRQFINPLRKKVK